MVFPFKLIHLCRELIWRTRLTTALIQVIQVYGKNHDLDKGNDCNLGGVTVGKETATEGFVRLSFRSTSKKHWENRGSPRRGEQDGGAWARVGEKSSQSGGIENNQGSGRFPPGELYCSTLMSQLEPRLIQLVHHWRYSLREQPDPPTLHTFLEI